MPTSQKMVAHFIKTSLDELILRPTQQRPNYNPGRNIWHKVKKYSKIGQDFKNVISNFAGFLTAIVNF